MGDQDGDPVGLLKGLAEKYSQVKLGPGVVSKTARVILVVIGVWALIIWRLRGDLVFDLTLVGCGAIVTAVGLWWTRRTQEFADRNPGAALLEGADLIEYKKFEAQAKGLLPGPEDLGKFAAIEAPNADDE